MITVYKYALNYVLICTCWAVCFMLVYIFSSSECALKSHFCQHYLLLTKNTPTSKIYNHYFDDILNSSMPSNDWIYMKLIYSRDLIFPNNYKTEKQRICKVSLLWWNLTVECPFTILMKTDFNSGAQQQCIKSIAVNLKSMLPII